MFVVDANRELVGYSAWPWDGIYTPLVGCFRDGRLVTQASCGLERQPVPLAGPDQQWWFRMRVDPQEREALLQGDPAVKLMRLEDGEPVPFAGDGAGDAAPRADWRVEQLVAVGGARKLRLDGFPALLGAPLLHQLDILFLDILNRLPDPEARQHYMRVLETGQPILELRHALLGSEEFARRQIGASDRVGSLLTSSMWRDLAQAEPLGLHRQPLRTIRMRDYEGMSDLDFGQQIHLDVHGDEPTEAARRHFALVAEARGRRDVVMLLVRAASTSGRFLDVVEG